MGDGAQVLAARVEDSEATATAARVLAWLVEHGVVEATPTDSGLGALAHRPGPNVLDFVVAQRPGVMDFRKLRTNGMQVDFSRRARLVVGGEELPTFACPSCTREAEADDVLSLLDELESPFAPPPQLECAACGVHSAVTDLVVTGAGAFANVSLRFWNWWPLMPSFVAEVSAKIGAKVNVLHDLV